MPRVGSQSHRKKNSITLINNLLIINSNDLQQHVSALESHLQAECKKVYIKQCHKMEEIVDSIRVILYSLLLYLLYNIRVSMFQKGSTHC
jgi:hypothetical protein